MCDSTTASTDLLTRGYTAKRYSIIGIALTGFDQINGCIQTGWRLSFFFSFSFANKNLRWLYFLLDIIKRVVYVEVPVFRPLVPNFIPDLVELKDLMKICWEEDPDNRPDFSEIKKRIHKTVVTKGMWVDIVFMLSGG